jgi:hypothetical protein
VVTFSGSFVVGIFYFYFIASTDFVNTSIVCSSSCITRYFVGSGALSQNRNGKCPVCAVHICQSDLRNVILDEEKVVAEMLESLPSSGPSPGPPSACSGTGGASSSSSWMHRKEVAVPPGTYLEFVHLSAHAHAVYPHIYCRQSPTTSSIDCRPQGIAAAAGGGGGGASSSSLKSVKALADKIPEFLQINARYSRLSFLSVENMSVFVDCRRRELAQFRAACLPSERDIPVPSAPSSSSSSQKPGSHSPKMPWGQAVQICDSTATATATATAHGNSAADPRPVGMLPSDTGGDVEMLPFIETMSQQLDNWYQNFVQQLQLAVSLNLSGGGGGGSGSGNPVASNNGSSGSCKPHSKEYSVLQVISGSMVFLDPLCATCLLEVCPTPLLSSLSQSQAQSQLSLQSQPQVQLSLQSQPQAQSQARSQPQDANRVDGGATSHRGDSLGDSEETPGQVAPSGGPFPGAAAVETVSAWDTQSSWKTVRAYDSGAHTGTGVGAGTAIEVCRGRVLDVERVRNSEASRQRHKFLRHLPIHCEVLFVEIDMSALVPPHVFERYRGKIEKRARDREEAHRRLLREEQEHNDRM